MAVAIVHDVEPLRTIAEVRKHPNAYGDALLMAAARDLRDALVRLMAAERAADRALRASLVADRFNSPDKDAKATEQTLAGRELTAAWEAARAALAKAGDDR
ncbi:MAG: hypothetical protein V4466_12085 [Pseudomonadota bacterium]